MNKPKLIIVTGLPGAGKTTLAKELSNKLFCPAIIRDEIKEGYVNTFNTKHDNLPKETNRIVSDLFFKNIDLLIKNNVTLIAEAAFPHPYWKSLIDVVGHLCKLNIVICDITPDVAAIRHLERGLANPEREFFHGDARVEHYRKTGVCLPCDNYEPPNFDCPTWRVTTLNGYDPSIETICVNIKNS